MNEIVPSLSELGTAFKPDMALLDNVLRTSVVYLTLYVLFRFFFRRESGSLGITNLLVLVLIADGVQNGMSGSYMSVTNALVIGLTLLFWSYILDYLDFRFAVFQRFIKPAPSLLIRDGQLVRRTMRQEMLTRDEIMAELRLNGVERIEDVKEAFVEASGEISVIKKGEGKQQSKGSKRKVP